MADHNDRSLQAEGGWLFAQGFELQSPARPAKVLLTHALGLQYLRHWWPPVIALAASLRRFERPSMS